MREHATPGPWTFASYSWAGGIGTIVREREFRDARGRVVEVEQRVERLAQPACRTHEGWSTDQGVRDFIDRGLAFPVRRF